MIWPQARWLDPAAAFCIVIYILNAARLGRRALDQLMDREIGPHAREQAVAAAFETPEVLAVHDVRTRAAGPLTFVQLHIELDADLPLSVTHDIADRVEESTRPFPTPMCWCMSIRWGWSRTPQAMAATVLRCRTVRYSDSRYWTGTQR